MWLFGAKPFTKHPLNRERLLRSLLSPNFRERRAHWTSVMKGKIVELVEPHLPDEENPGRAAVALAHLMRGNRCRCRGMS